MGIESAFLRKLPGFIFIALAIVSQLYLCKKAGISKRKAWWLVGSYITLCVTLTLELFPDPPRPISYYEDRLGSILTMWGWIADVAAFIVYFKSRIESRFGRNFSPARRQFLNTTAAAICAAPAVALTTGIIIRKDFQIKEFDLKIAGLPKDLNGLRVLQLSDIHMGTYFSPNDLRRVVDASNNLRADIGFITGDLITNASDPIDDCLAELKRLKSASGFWGCMGNHEHSAKVSNYVARQALKQDLLFLRSESQTLNFGSAKLNLVGVDHQFKSEGYLVGTDRLVKPDEFNLLLSHNPDVFPVAAKQGFQLTLSGHTHGGQINIEVAHTNLNIVDLVTPYTKGLYQRPGSSLYVTSGLGTIGVPVRLGSPPEITLIRLCAS